METKLQFSLTLNDLKFEARRREAERKEQERRRLEEDRARIERHSQMLLDMLATTAPFSEFFTRGVVTLGDVAGSPFNNDTEIIVHLMLPEHAEIQVRFIWERDRNGQQGHWEHQGFLTNKGYDYSYWVADDEKLWRVSEWNGTKYDPETETFTAAYRSVDFKDLGDALLHAERAWRSPVSIQYEVDEMHAKQMAVRDISAPAAEPTAAEILVDALKAYIDERVDQRNADRLLSNY